MRDSSGLHFHAITSNSDWPSAIQPVARLLTERIPQWVARGPHPPTTPIAAYLIPELEKLAGNISSSADSPKSPYPELKDSFDLVMSSCADLRALASMSPMEPVLVKTITFGLVAALFRNCSNNLIPRKHAKFRDGGEAEFLLVHIMTHEEFAVSEDKFACFLQSELDERSDQEDEDVEMADNQAQLNVDDNEEISGSEEGLSVGYPSAEALQNVPVFRRRGSSWYAQPDIPFAMTETELSDISTRPSLASLEVPERAHILMSSPSLTYVDVPVVCIAETEAMPFVMSKLLHQRQVWGVTEPVVGFIITSDGLTVQLAMGWIDESGMEPTRHWATPCNSSSKENIGIYHLTNPFQCLAFASLILGLYEHTSLKEFLQTLRHQARRILLPTWSWSPETTRVVTSKEDFIEKWRLEVASSAQIGIESLPFAVNNGFLSSTYNAPGQCTQSVDASSIPQTQLAFIDQSQYSHARCHDTEADEHGCTVIEFLTDRNIFAVPYVVADIPDLEIIEFVFLCMTDMMSIYDNDIRPRWVKAWEHQTALPNLGSRLMKYGEELFANDRLRETQIFLEQEAANSLCNHFRGIIECCDLARTRTRGGGRQQSWDQLLAKTTLVVDSTNSGLLITLCNPGINLPVNPYRSRFLSKNCLVFEDLREYLMRIFLLDMLYSEAVHASLKIRPPATCRSNPAQCQIMGEEAERCLAQIEALRFKDPGVSTATFEAIIRQRCSSEPLLGTCDIILAVQCGSVGRQIHEMIFDALYASRPLSTTLQDVFNKSVEMMDDFHLILSRPGVILSQEPPLAFSMKSTESSGRHARRNATVIPTERAHRSGARDDLDMKSLRSLFASYTADLPSLDLMLPSLFVIFSDAEDNSCNELKATNQARICAAAALTFLDVFDIVNEPIYLLVVSGGRGTLSMAMCNQRESEPDGSMKKQRLIMDRVVRTFDIANTIDLYEFTVFVQALAERGRKLKTRFLEQILPLFLRRVKKDPSILRWSARSWSRE